MMLYLFCRDGHILLHWINALNPYNPQISELPISYDDRHPVAVVFWDFFEEHERSFLKSIGEGVKLFLLDAVPSFERAQKAIALGAHGYANAMMHDVHLCSAVQTIMDGQMWIYPDFVSKLISDMSKPSALKPEESEYLSKLTPREQELALQIAYGATQYEIAQKMDISIRTVKAHTASIYEKLEVKDRLSLSLLLRSSTKVQ
jgi:NarL family two-component system response regulator LiaR